MWDHPRACGVYVVGRCTRRGLSGSSPRVRGLRRSRAFYLRRARIIPARAGFTRHGDGRTPSRPDHPRACGVYETPSDSDATARGSSPRVRGLRQKPWKINPKPRIIPARAGFTSSASRVQVSSWDHPRACGVYDPRLDTRRHRLGSSPRVRGLQHDDHPQTQAVRIIPARAGFTGASWSISMTGADHPRACGVYLHSRQGLAFLAGSSPRVRGLLPSPLPLFVSLGIIPARAGFTFMSALASARPTDHPRACGVYDIATDSDRLTRGSSPRVRGLPSASTPPAPS